MRIETTIPLLEETLAPWRETIGADYDAYRNHVYRMVHFCLALHPCDETQRQKVIIAACHHDLGIWSDQTLDYLPPSSTRARDYLAARHPDWAEEVSLMIDTHHKLRAYRDARYPLVEAFRKADLIDVSLGLIRFGLSRQDVRRVKRQFPNAGFHRKLARLLRSWFCAHPLRLPPFIKW